MGWELIGHGWAVSVLRRHIETDAVRHAYLFTGPDEVGKRTLALRFAQALNCEQGAELCGECRACELVPSQGYPDLIVLGPESGLQVDAVRALHRQLTLSPYEGRWKVAVLPDFQLATASASNALLKTLEEPPSQVVMLLTAPSEEAVLPTISSRCEIVGLRAVPAERIERALVERGAEGANLMAAAAMGRPGRALQLAFDPERLARRGEAHDLLRSLLRLDPIERFQRMPQLVGKGRPAEQRSRAAATLDEWLALGRDLMHLAYAVPTPLANPDQETWLRDAASKWSRENIRRSLAAMHAAREAMAGNANVQLTLENLMMELP